MNSIHRPDKDENFPGLTPVDVPQQYRRHPLVSNGPFFTLPKPLLERLVAAIGVNRFDCALLEMDHTMGEVSCDHSSQGIPSRSVFRAGIRRHAVGGTPALAAC